MCGRVIGQGEQHDLWGFGEIRCSIGSGCDNRQLENSIVEHTECATCTIDCTDDSPYDGVCSNIWYSHV